MPRKSEKAKKPRRIVIGEGYLGYPCDIRFYCGLPVWEHNAMRPEGLMDRIGGKKIRLVAEVL